MKYKLLFITLLLLSSCQNNSKPLPEGTYILPQDSCKSIHFKKEEKIACQRSCGAAKASGIVLTRKLSGETVELFCGGDLDYEIDHIDKNQGIYLRTIDKNGEVCRGYHIIQGAGYIVLTELKKGEGIDFHFTEPKVYLKQGAKDLEMDSTKLIVAIPAGKAVGINYIAYDQQAGKATSITGKADSYLKLGEGSTFKTQLVINPKHYALQTYEFVAVDGKARKQLPVLYHREYQSMRQQSEDQQAKYMEARGIKKGEKYIVLHRFNPGRKRNVNQVFAEAIKGQVQSFEMLVY